MPHPVDWNALGLTGNPFENITPGEHLDWVDVPTEIAAAISTRPFRVELIGEKGAGKSTLLRWYAATHADAQYHYVTGPKSAPQLRDDARVICLDESNNAAPATLKRVVASGRSLFIGTHVSLAPHIVGLKTFELAKHPSLSWLHRRVAAASLPGGPRVDLAGLASELAPRASHVNYALQRVLYELAENLARGVELHAAVDDAFRRARQDDTVAPLLR